MKLCLEQPQNVGSSVQMKTLNYTCSQIWRPNWLRFQPEELILFSLPLANVKLFFSQRRLMHLELCPVMLMCHIWRDE